MLIDEPLTPLAPAGGRALPGLLLAESGLRRGQPCDRHSVGRATDIVEAERSAEGHRGGFPAVLAADAEFEFRTHRAPAFDAEAHERADPVLVDGLERVVLQDAQLHVRGEEASRVVA